MNEVLEDYFELHFYNWEWDYDNKKSNYKHVFKAEKCSVENFDPDLKSDFNEFHLDTAYCLSKNYTATLGEQGEVKS